MLLRMTKTMLKFERIGVLNRRGISLAAIYIACLVCLMAGVGGAQVNAPAASVQLSSTPESPQPNAATAAPQAITFSDALQRARENNPQMQRAVSAASLAHEDLVQSRAALLPNVTYNMSASYTQPTPGTSSAHNSPIFLANNAVHESIA